jgi:hypothetical protein
MVWIKTFEEKEASGQLAEVLARTQRLVEQNADKG